MRDRTSHSLDVRKIRCPKCRESYLEPLSESEQFERLPYYSVRRVGSLIQAEVPNRSEILFVCRMCERSMHAKPLTEAD